MQDADREAKGTKEVSGVATRGELILSLLVTLAMVVGGGLGALYEPHWLYLLNLVLGAIGTVQVARGLWNRPFFTVRVEPAGVRWWGASSKERYIAFEEIESISCYFWDLSDASIEFRTHFGQRVRLNSTFLNEADLVWLRDEIAQRSRCRVDWAG